MLLVAINSLLIRVIFPVAAVGSGILAQKYNWGLFNNISVSLWIKIPVSIIFLDFIIYLQHRLFHKLPILWAIHKIHHTDLDVDATTGLRFHPIEIMIAMFTKIIVVISLGAPMISILIFEILLNATAMFSHGNISIPGNIDKYLRLVVVTPDMHRVHHSMIWQETSSNFGFNLPWWDRLFKTYINQPQEGHKNMTIGIHQFHDVKYSKINWLLIIPFLKTKK